jgi:hypothetical protein
MLATAKATKYDSVDYDDLKVTVFGNTDDEKAEIKVLLREVARTENLKNVGITLNVLLDEKGQRA